MMLWSCMFNLNKATCIHVCIFARSTTHMFVLYNIIVLYVGQIFSGQLSTYNTIIRYICPSDDWFLHCNNESIPYQSFH